jgi:hypothetical protein
MILYIYICFHEFLLHLLYTGGNTKKTGNLNLAFEKADSTSTPPPQKRESTRKKVGVSAP